MVESLGPLVSVLKLFLEGISKAAKTIKTSKHKAMQRKIIEIQLSLEDIIENAQYLFALVERSSHTPENKNGKLFEDFKKSLYAQRQRIRIFMDQITDHTSEEILKLFAPNLRRNVSILTQRKMSAINRVLLAMYDITEKAKISKDGLKVTIQSALLIWDHKRFVGGGESCLAELGARNKKAEYYLSDHLEEQKEIIRCLIWCSKEFSQFIKEHIKIEDAVGLVKKRAR